MLGTETAREIGANYAEILAREVRLERWCDPRTGRYAGVQLTDVLAGGVVAEHGGQSGDVVLSINGHPVTSPQQAISYVKNNADSTTEWHVVVLRLGAEETLSFVAPAAE